MHAEFPNQKSQLAKVLIGSFRRQPIRSIVTARVPCRHLKGHPECPGAVSAPEGPTCYVSRGCSAFSMRAAPKGGALAPGRLAPCSWGVCKLVIMARMPCRHLKDQTVAEDCQRAVAMWATLLNTRLRGVDERSANNNGDPDRIRTCDPQIRNLMLYPAELRDRQGRLSTLRDRHGTGKNRHRPNRAGRNIIHRRRKMGGRPMYSHSRPPQPTAAFRKKPAKLVSK